MLPPDKAERLHDEIWNLTTKMSVHEGYYPYFQFRHHNLYINEDPDSFASKYHVSSVPGNHACSFACQRCMLVCAPCWAPQVQTLTEIFNSKIVRDWFASLANVRLSNETSFGLSEYQPNEYTMLHSDHKQYENGDHRRVAFVSFNFKNCLEL